MRAIGSPLTGSRVEPPNVIPGLRATVPDLVPICTVTVGVLVDAGGAAPDPAELEEVEPPLLQPEMVASVTTEIRRPATAARRALIFATVFLPHESAIEILSCSLSINESACGDIARASRLQTPTPLKFTIYRRAFFVTWLTVRLNDFDKLILVISNGIA